jgi:CRP-like cAMP-binding protein
MDESATQSRKNRLLELLSPQDFDRLRGHLHSMTFNYKMALSESQKPISFVYFPVSGVVSLVNVMADGSAAEVGTIGNEGLVGLPIVFGDNTGPTTIYVQVPGFGLRLPADVFRHALDDSPTLRAVMLRYAHAMFDQIAQSAACNHFHTIEQRCCRWLLMTHDRVQSDQFLLTHEFLGMMLGARRSGVTVVAGKLKQRKLIEYQRGHVTVLDRQGLEKRSCECYRVNKQEFDRLLGPPHGLEQSPAEQQQARRS